MSQGQMRKSANQRRADGWAARTRCANCGHVGMTAINQDWAAFKFLLKVISLGLLALVMPGWSYQCPKCGYKQRKLE